MFPLFITVFEMSIKASVVIAFVLLSRVLLSKAPKRFSYLLWSVVGIRLSVPVGISSDISIFGLFKAFSESGESVQAQNVAIEQAINSSSATANAYPSALVWFLRALPWVWLAGMAVMGIYGIVSYCRMHIRMNTAMLVCGNVYESEKIESPFALGIIKPKIYLPLGLNPIQQGCIVAHEKYHIKRFDHIVKLISFLILVVHWFNPLCWVAFRKMTMDMEMSCDEGVLKNSNDENMKKLYSKTLLAIGSGNRRVVPNPVSFDGGVAKKRILHILKYKAPNFPTVFFCYAMCIVLIVVCSTDTKAEETFKKASEIAASVSEYNESESPEGIEMEGSVKYIGVAGEDTDIVVAPNYQ